MSQPPAFLRSALVRHSVSLALGVTIAVFLHFLLFRLSLPIKPFIYVAF